jgi:hypothetical protein
VSLPSVTNGLDWQTVLKARFDRKCNLGAVANPPLHRRPHLENALNGLAANRLTRSVDRIAAAATAALINAASRDDGGNKFEDRATGERRMNDA